VTLSTSSGGYFDLYRSANGNAKVLRVYGTPKRTTLTGSIVRNRLGGDGRTVLERLVGASVGQVVSKLKTPPFILTRTDNLVRVR
jgi:hypothetical protein